MARKKAPVDGNAACGTVAHALSEVCAIYPITPSSPMGELADAKSAAGVKNIWGTVPLISELQSEGGASGSVHGALTAGAMVTTFTASQGLLLMLPNMFKIAGELTPTCFQVTARSIATHALSIFGDHSDVLAARGTGFALLASSSVQEAHDMALIGTAASVESRIPFLHFFDGFRTSHEIQKIEMLDEEDLKAVIDNDAVLAHRARGLTSDRPAVRGTAQNPDVFMQAREAVNTYYDKCADIVENVMDRFAKQVGRAYKHVDYVGHPEADHIIIIMGSGADTAEETCRYLYEKEGKKLGLVKVHLYRPWSIKHFLSVLPKTARKFAVLDRTKEPGSVGEPMYEDVRTAFGEAMQDDKSLFDGNWPLVVGGRYGLSSKEFTPAMVKAVYDNLDQATPKNHFTVGINDDVTKTSIEYDHEWDIEPDAVSRCMFYGLGSDGTVGANKNSIKIIADYTDNYAQGYFVYDSKKAGAVTVSHLRFGPDPIKSEYLIRSANFVACHQWSFLEKYDMLKNLKKGGVFLLNSIYGADKVWDELPKEVQQQIIDKEAQLYVIDAYDVGQKTGMGVRINTIMQTCFFAISGVLPKDDAIKYIKDAIKKTYSKKGEEIVQKNYAAVDGSLEHLHKVDYPKQATSTK
ncbi:MAG: pyruvate:ferredoxin (flavodoxin) oxidoreductase, partial [Planctomycetes bacterium]|nr:pyruvate:ferredoxin (flavodoxin) oxidoreductase [Planctomycetota bacterium]